MADQYDLLMDPRDLETTAEDSDEEWLLDSDNDDIHADKPPPRFFKPETNTILVIMLICFFIYTTIFFFKHEYDVCYRTYVRDQAAANNATLQLNLEAINATYASYLAQLEANPGSTSWFSFLKVLEIPTAPKMYEYIKLPNPCSDFDNRGLFVKEHLVFSLTNARASRWHTFLTSSITHGHFVHLFLNMYVVWKCGRPILRLLGLSHFVIIWILGGLSSGLFSMIAQSSVEKITGIGFVESGSVGASGSLCALTAVLALAAPRYKVNVIPFVPILTWYNSFETGISVLYTLGALKWGWKFTGKGVIPEGISIDDTAHLGGFVLGALYWLLVLRRRRSRRDRTANVRRLRSL
jgi:membrane associated rhomboid family serine protease